MMFSLVRKIAISKWNQRKVLNGEVPSADAITSCMRTSNNTLSVWMIKDEGELDDAVLAMISKFTSIDKIDIIIINPEILKQNDIFLEKSSGDTHYSNFIDKHRDLVNLDYVSLGRVANVIVESLRNKCNRRFTAKKLKDILIKGIEDGKIQTGDLDKELLVKLYPDQATN